MRFRPLLAWLARSSVVAVIGCNAIVGTQDITYVEPATNPSPTPTSTSNPPPPGEGDAGESVVAPPDASAGADAEFGGDAGVDEGTDGGVAGDA